MVHSTGFNTYIYIGTKIRLQRFQKKDVKIELGVNPMKFKFTGYPLLSIKLSD